VRANEPNDCGHSCYDAECQGGPDPLCPVHGMTPEELYEAAKAAAWNATVTAGGFCAPSVMNPREFTTQAVRDAVQRMRDAPAVYAVGNCSDCDDPRDHTWPAYSDLCGACADRRQASWDDVDPEGYDHG
jgi:hypothetical protein